MPKNSSTTAPSPPMRVGVYVDGLNLDMGAEGLPGNDKPGWRWFDIRAFADGVIGGKRGWKRAQVDRVVLCIARFDQARNATRYNDQDTYLKALEAAGSVSQIEFGWHVSKVKSAPLAVPDRSGRPILVSSGAPVKIKDATGQTSPNANFFVSYAHCEEKGSDVNVATHLLADVLLRAVDAAVVISNDTDLCLPIRLARNYVPVGLVNPTSGPRAGALSGSQR